MYPLLWLLIYALLCAACDVSNGHSVLTSRLEETTVREVTLLLTDSTTEAPERPTRGSSAAKPLCYCQFHSGPPYGPDMTMSSQTTMSRDLPSTSPIDGEQETQITPRLTQQTASSATFGSSSDETTTSPITAPGDKMTDPPPTDRTTDMDSGSSASNPTSAENTSPLETRTTMAANGNKPASDVTETLVDAASTSEIEWKGKASSVTTTSTKQPPPTTLMRSTTSSSEEAVPSQNTEPEEGEVQQWPVCNGRNSGPTMAVASRMISAKSFCDQFREAPLTLEGWRKKSRVDGILFGVNFSKSSSQSCDEYRVDDVVCRKHLVKVERLCGKFGGFVIGECVLVWSDPDLGTTA
ncbi:hypothetical protein FPOAC2_13460 [Fusarium poae]